MKSYIEKPGSFDDSTESLDNLSVLGNSTESLNNLSVEELKKQLEELKTQLQKLEDEKEDLLKSRSQYEPGTQWMLDRDVTSNNKSIEDTRQKIVTITTILNQKKESPKETVIS